MNFDRIIDRAGTYSVKYDEREAKFGTDDLLPLWVADMDLPSPECVVQALQRRAGHPIYGYTVYPDRFFEAIVRWMRQRHGWKIQRETIIPIPGVVPALDFLVTALTEPDDAILIQPPVYHPFFRLAKNHGRRSLENRLRFENGRYEIDFDDFRKKAKEAKLFILCSPHNPVGRVWRHEELETMVHICLEEKCLIVSDEIHADIVYAGNRHIPTASLSPEVADITITLNAPSKTFNIAGLNTAYAIISNDSLRRRFETELRRYDLTMGNLFGVEALMAAYEGGETWLEALLAYLQGNIDFVTGFLAREMPAIRPISPEATYLMWLDCQALGMDDERLEKFFVEKAKLGLNTGLSFGSGGSGFMRLNIGCPRPILEEAMGRLKEAEYEDA
ncbi:MalY/PatB family protein [Hydrogenimonas cancrithermarum]|uniref:cysteine-S-conjugate beta-lyase n=1 Tax=Hydrogenimonas cancrithermarum TaxID=2993563 RepID=A0ABM8FJP4_9BACT|nr:PatB family C-S lyase [Hydrogenimonas cancrithermarum]BDY12509.1 aminotransferase [Hydrogenimonas cancrithermarum]